MHINGSLQYRILTCVKRFTGYNENSIHNLMQTRLYYGPDGYKLELSIEYWWKFSKSNINEIREMVHGMHGEPIYGLNQSGFYYRSEACKSEFSDNLW
jgi:hypothetical protein